MDDILEARLRRYASHRQIRLAEPLGFGGFHGIVQVAEDNRNFGKFAVKAHRYEPAYQREKAAYLRLRELSLTMIRGFNVPVLTGWNDYFLIVEMSIVTRPFVLDFAETYLDQPPEFPVDLWQEQLEKREQFGDRWEEVQRVLAVLRTHGLYMFDISPTNIAFRE